MFDRVNPCGLFSESGDFLPSRGGPDPAWTLRTRERERERERERDALPVACRQPSRHQHAAHGTAEGASRADEGCERGYPLRPGACACGEASACLPPCPPAPPPLCSPSLSLCSPSALSLSLCSPSPPPCAGARGCPAFGLPLALVLPSCAALRAALSQRGALSPLSLSPRSVSSLPLWWWWWSGW